MAFRRQELTQRRKAVGFTQESLAEHLGVERSTVIRWEAGDSEPLPSIRPNLARALQISIDQLAGLLATSEDDGTTRILSSDFEATVPVRSAEVEPQRRPGGSEFPSLLDPQVAEAVEALRRALRSTGVCAEDLAAMLLVGGSSQGPLGAPGPDVPAPLHTAAPNRPVPSSIPPVIEPVEVQRSRVNSCKRFAAVVLFVLALPAIWLSAPFVFSRSVEFAAPVFASPAANSGGHANHDARSPDSSGAIPTAPIVTPAGGPAPPAPAAATAPPTSRASVRSRSTDHAARVHRPSPRIPEWVPAVAGDRWKHRIDQVNYLW
jgi:transcriptional regulator with XRE-family HTH domain